MIAIERSYMRYDQGSKCHDRAQPLKTQSEKESVSTSHKRDDLSVGEFDARVLAFEHNTMSLFGQLAD